MVRFRGKSQGATSHAIRLGGALLSPQAHCHVCAFFNNPDEECRVLLPLIREGIESGEKAFHTVDPQRYEAHLQRLASAGIDVTATLQRASSNYALGLTCIFEMGSLTRPRRVPILRRSSKDAKRQGFPLVWFVTHMEWAW